MNTTTLILTEKEKEVIVAGLHSVLIGGNITTSLLENAIPGKCSDPNCTYHGPIARELRAARESLELSRGILRKLGVSFDAPDEAPAFEAPSIRM